MTDRTNRYRRQDRRDAYEKALKLAKAMEELKHPEAFLEIFKQLDPNLSREGRRQVAAKAVRVVRGRRIAQQYITLHEAGRRHNVPISTLRYHAASGSFAAVKRGKTWLAEAKDMARWVAERNT